MITLLPTDIKIVLSYQYLEPMAVNRSEGHSAVVEGLCNLRFVIMRSFVVTSRISGDESVFCRKIAAPFTQHQCQVTMDRNLINCGWAEEGSSKLYTVN